IRDEDGREYLYRVQKFSQGDAYSGYSLLLAAEADFAQNVRELQIRGIIIALIAGCCFVPAVWMFGSRMSNSLKRITAQAGRLRTLAAPDDTPVTSRVAEIHELGSTLAVAQRSIWAFARFVSKDIVKGIIDGSISTELGGVKREVTILFTDVTNFTGMAERADPDSLMRQTSRHFAALTEAFHAEGGTVDKFIGDSVMVFWNAPHLQPDHVERACRAALSAKAASDALNAQFEAEGLPPVRRPHWHPSRGCRGGKCGFGRAHELYGTGKQRESCCSPRGAEQGLRDDDARQRGRTRPSRALLPIQAHRLGNRQGDDDGNARL